MFGGKVSENNHNYTYFIFLKPGPYVYFQLVYLHVSIEF